MLFPTGLMSYPFGTQRPKGFPCNQDLRSRNFFAKTQFSAVDDSFKGGTTRLKALWFWIWMANQTRNPTNWHGRSCSWKPSAPLPVPWVSLTNCQACPA
jgi:hypothetical protein